ncbi:biotin/lipoyl-containing protein [Flagellimonas sp. 2504JD4-2]
MKTDAELNGRFLEYDETENIIFPKELLNGNDWIIKEWFFEKGQLVQPGDVIGAVENKTQRFEFESFVGGKLNYFKKPGQKVQGGQILAEIIGCKKN